MKTQLRAWIQDRAIPGKEGTLCAKIAQEMKPFCEEVYPDAMGNLIAVKYGKDRTLPPLAFCAAMDEDGMTVTDIYANGNVAVAPLGAPVFSGAAYAQMTTQSGVQGVLTPTDAGATKLAQTVLDIGAKSKAAALRRIRIGDGVGFVPFLKKLGGSRYLGYPLDARVGCVLLWAVAKELSAPARDVYFYFTVQKQMQGRGAAVLPVKNGTVLCVESINASCGAPDAADLSDGALIVRKAGSFLSDTALCDALCAVAETEKLPYRLYVADAGETQAQNVQLRGAEATVGVVGVPVKNPHTPAQMLDSTDLEAVKALLLAYAVKETEC